MTLSDGTTIPIAWLMGAVTAAGTVIWVLFSTFKTKDDAADDHQEVKKEIARVEESIHQRLIRIEDKLDTVIRRR